MTEKKKLFIDFDNTIVNSIKAICDLYNEDYKFHSDYKPITWTDIRTWDFDEISLLSSEVTSMYFSCPRFFDVVGYMSFACEVLGELIDSNKYDIYIVTMGSTANLKLKEDWWNSIFGYGNYIKFIGLNFDTYKNKSSIDMSGGILIDDDPRYLNTSNAAIKICFGEEYEWNKNWNGLRMKKWTDLRRYLLE